MSVERNDMIDTEHTPGPWVQFSDQGKCIAIMPAMREGDICTFDQPPSAADAMLMNAGPEMLKALLEFVSTFRTVPGSIGDEVKEGAFRAIEKATGQEIRTRDGSRP